MLDPRTILRKMWASLTQGWTPPRQEPRRADSQEIDFDSIADQLRKALPDPDLFSGPQFSVVKGEQPDSPDFDSIADQIGELQVDRSPFDRIASQLSGLARSLSGDTSGTAAQAQTQPNAQQPLAVDASPFESLSDELRNLAESLQNRVSSGAADGISDALKIDFMRMAAANAEQEGFDPSPFLRMLAELEFNSQATGTPLQPNEVNNTVNDNRVSNNDNRTFNDVSEAVQPAVNRVAEAAASPPIESRQTTQEPPPNPPRSRSVFEFFTDRLFSRLNRLAGIEPNETQTPTQAFLDAAISPRDPAISQADDSDNRTLFRSVTDRLESLSAAAIRRRGDDDSVKPTVKDGLSEMMRRAASPEPGSSATRVLAMGAASIPLAALAGIALVTRALGGLKDRALAATASLSKYSGTLSLAQSQLEARRTLRDIAMARAVQDSGRDLIASQNRLEQATAPYRALAQNIENRLAGFAADTAATLLENADKIAGAFNPVLGLLAGVAKDAGQQQMLNAIANDPVAADPLAFHNSILNMGLKPPKPPQPPVKPAGPAAGANQ